MSVSVKIPEIATLRLRVEKTYGKSLETHNAFISLVGDIERALREHLSESTLERLWGYSTREVEAISIRTLNVLARYIGYCSWKDFCIDLKNTSLIESEEFFDEFIVVSDLQLGSIIRLGWLPNRVIEVKYLGDNRFEIVSSLNSSLRPGDSFECIQIQEGRPLYLDRFRRAGSSNEARYVAGEKNGLTAVQIVGGGD